MHNGRCPVAVVSGVPVVTAPEEIDVISAPELRSALLEATVDGHRTLVVDMTRTEFCDSSGPCWLIRSRCEREVEACEVA